MLVPAQIVAILGAKGFDPARLASLECLISLGAPLLKPDKDRLNAALPGRLHELYGLTEGFVTILDRSQAVRKAGSVGVPPVGFQMRIVREDGSDAPTGEPGEIVGRGPMLMTGYHNRSDLTAQALRDGWLHTGDVGKVDEDGYVFITGRKKDIIITAGGKNLTPANLENDLKQTRWVSQAVMHGDRRPFPVMLITLDEEEIVPWAQQQNIEDTSIPALASHPEVHALIQAGLDKANEKYAQVEQVKKFFILDHDLTQETGELTPTLKVKRNVVNEKYAGRFDALYG